MNYIVAKDGLENPRGMGIQTAKVLQDNVKSGLLLTMRSQRSSSGVPPVPMPVWAAATIPRWSRTASGNQGLMVVMGPRASAKYRKMSDEDGYRAVAFALLSEHLHEVISVQGIRIHAAHLLPVRPPSHRPPPQACIPARPDSSADQRHALHLSGTDAASSATVQSRPAHSACSLLSSVLLRP